VLLIEQMSDLAAVIDFALKPPADGNPPIYISWYRLEINSDLHTAHIADAMSKLALGSNPLPDASDHVNQRLQAVAQRTVDETNKKRPTAQVVVLCDGCGSVTGEMMRCSRCKAVRYCSKDWFVACFTDTDTISSWQIRFLASSQTKAWKQHKKDCVEIRDKSKQLLSRAMAKETTT